MLRFGHVGNDVSDSFAMYRLLLFVGRVLMEEGSDAMGELWALELLVAGLPAIVACDARSSFRGLDLGFFTQTSVGGGLRELKLLLSSLKFATVSLDVTLMVAELTAGHLGTFRVRG